MINSYMYFHFSLNKSLPLVILISWLYINSGNPNYYCRSMARPWLDNRSFGVTTFLVFFCRKYRGKTDDGSTMVPGP